MTNESPQTAPAPVQQTPVAQAPEVANAPHAPDVQTSQGQTTAPASQQKKWDASLPQHQVTEAGPQGQAAAQAQPASAPVAPGTQPHGQAAPNAGTAAASTAAPSVAPTAGQGQAVPAPAPEQGKKPEATKEPATGFKALLPVFKKIAIVVIACAAVYGAISFGWHAYHYVETDDAQVAGHSAVLSARVGGTVTQVLVDENQNVKQGQLLATLDQRDYQHALDQAAGDLQSIFSRQKEAEMNFKRAKTLIRSDSITKQEYDDNQAQYLDYTKKLASQVALVEQAKTNLAYTEVRAPVDGKIGKKSVEPGIVIAPGQSLFTFVETSERWVIANYKETQLRHMRVGQKAEIDVDAVSDHTFSGHVESFSPGSGSSFALIPPDNATGNYTKIVQRIPVKVVFDKDSIAGYEDRVVPGESVVINVRIR